MARLLDSATVYLWESAKYTNLDVDIYNQALQRVILVAKHRAVTLQGFTQDIRDACDIMDSDQYNQLRIVRNAIWLLHLEVHADNKKMIVKPGGQLNHGKPVSVANERALARFIPENFLLPKKI